MLDSMEDNALCVKQWKLRKTNVLKVKIYCTLIFYQKQVNPFSNGEKLPKVYKKYRVSQKKLCIAISLLLAMNFWLGAPNLVPNTIFRNCRPSMFIWKPSKNHKCLKTTKNGANASARKYKLGFPPFIIRTVRYRFFFIFDCNCICICMGYGTCILNFLSQKLVVRCYPVAAAA